MAADNEERPPLEDPPEPPSRYHKEGDEWITLLDETIRALGADAACPFCHTEGWNVGPDSDAGVLAIHDPSTSRYTPVRVFTCIQCGFVRLHTKSRFDDKAMEILTASESDGA